MERADIEYGQLALTIGRALPLRVLGWGKNFFIGTADEEGPCSRESVEYWADKGQAEAALANRRWTQRREP